MDVLRQTLRPYRELFRSMSLSKRGTLVAVPVAIAAALGFLMFRDGASSYVALSWGKVFTTEELMSAEQTLIDGGLTNFRRDGQRLMVPADEVERYNAALLQGGSLPSNYAEELERQLDKQSVFTSERQAEAYRDLALKKELRRIIRAIPDVEDADVVWARGESGRWPNRGGKVTATLSVRLRRQRELSPTLIQSLRTAVANMVPDLNTADVVVLDLNTGRSYAPGRDGDHFDNGLLAQVRDFTHSYQQKISQALAYIPGVLVTVNVDLEGRKSSPAERTDIQPTQTHTAAFRQFASLTGQGADSNRPRELNAADGQGAANVPQAAAAVREFPGAVPRAVQVSIKIPTDYYSALALKQGIVQGSTNREKAEFRRVLEAIRVEEEKKAQATAAVLIPAGTLAISSFIPVDQAEATGQEPVPPSAAMQIGQWGSSVGLALFALCSLWMLRRGARRRSNAGRDLDGTSRGAPPAQEPQSETLAAKNLPRMDFDVPADPQENWGSAPLLRERVASPAPRNSQQTGATTAGRILNVTSPAIDGSISGIPNAQRATENVPSLAFEDFAELDDGAIRHLLDVVDRRAWAVALKGASDEMRQKVFRNLSPRAAESFRQEMDRLGPVRLSDLEATQQQIVEALASGMPG